MFFTLSLIFADVVQKITNLHHRYYICTQY